MRLRFIVDAAYHLTLLFCFKYMLLLFSEEEERLKNQEEQAPVKLLDDLFRKTKAEPWVYWLPLTDEQTAGRDKRRALELRQLQACHTPLVQ